MVMSLAGKKVLVMGLGRFGGGIGVSRWLVGQGAAVTVTDMATREELADSLKALEGLPLTFKLGGHAVADFLAADLVVINPAVDRAKSDVVQATLAHKVPVTSEMNLFLERCQGITVGITGSVGKSTTTALIYEALKAGLGEPHKAEEARQGAEKSRVFLGGNIGRSLLQDLPAIGKQDVVVLELSSFMLDETPQIGWSPNIAVVTNVYENHLDRHGTLAAYSAAKQNILRFQTPRDVAVLNNDHDLVARWVPLAKGKVVKFTTRGPGKLDLAMPGEHNQSNARAALAVVACLIERGVALDPLAAQRAMETFGGLAHRLQCVHTRLLQDGTAGEAGGVRKLRFYNDSKATSPDASITALRAFEPGTAIFIVGGYDKHIDLSAFEKLLATHAAGVIGIGATGQAIVERVGGLLRPPLKGTPRWNYAGTLEAAVALAGNWANELPQVGAVVLSPASASWDQFPNYEKRGEQFAEFAVKNG